MKTTVFLSYTHHDKDLARLIGQKLSEDGIQNWFPDEFYPGDTVVGFLEKDIPALERMKRQISGNDYIVVLLSSNAANSEDYKEVLNTVFSDAWANRGITVLPVVLANTKVPSFLTPDHYFKLQTNSEDDIANLAKRISLVKHLDFSKMQERTLSLLVEELLIRLGFEDVKAAHGADKGADIIAHYSRSDSSGRETTETWLVELKAYHSGRASTQAIYQLAYYLSHSPSMSKGLLITNSQLTSAARHLLIELTSEKQVEIRVIDSSELKILLLQNEDLIGKYFMKSMDR